MPLSNETILTNVDLVLDDDIVRGTIHFADGLICEAVTNESCLRIAGNIGHQARTSTPQRPADGRPRPTSFSPRG